MIKRIFLLIVLIVFASSLFAQDAALTLKHMQQKIKSSAGFSSEFIQSSISAEGKKIQNLKGKFTYGANDKFKVELKNTEIVSDGTTIWNYNKTQKRVLINNTADDPSSFSIERYLFKYPNYCTVTGVQEPKFKNSIKLVPKNNDLEFSEVIINADDEYQIKKILITDIQSNKYLLELNKVTLIDTIEKSLFDFSIPKGIKVIDMR
ncbi:MAG: outer-membrane lipoprotein carrier protein LolA [bacterium]